MTLPETAPAAPWDWVRLYRRSRRFKDHLDG